MPLSHISGTHYIEIFLFLGTGWDAFQPDIRDLHAGLLGLGFLFENVLSITSPGWMISCTNEKPAKIYIFGVDKILFLAHNMFLGLRTFFSLSSIACR